MNRKEFLENWAPDGKEEYKNFISDLAQLIVSERYAALEEFRQKSAKPGAMPQF
jgi:hypothetical protein